MNEVLAQQLRKEFDLTPSMATWIVLTHFFVLACPLAFIWAVNAYGNQLPTPLANPTLVLIASAVYIGATAFEVAQNSADRWYLTEATRSVADLFFNSFMTVAFWLYIVGFVGLGWFALVAAVPTVLFPFAYIANHPSHRGINGVVVLMATASLYWVTGDPAAFLFMVGTGVGVYFITFLIRRYAQVLHGWAAFFFGLGFLSWPWAILNAANGTRISWTTFGVVTVIIVAVLAAMAPMLNKSAATPRQFT